METRGPPGTHEVERLLAATRALLRGHSTSIPQFDKGTDDRVASIMLEGPVDRVLIEGWCVGALPYPDKEIAEPINQLERDFDPQAIWRRYVHAALKTSYQQLNELLDCLIFLKVPNIDAVRRWRLEQESERLPEQRMTVAQVHEFVAYYERITNWMLRETTQTADIVIGLNTAHDINEIKSRLR